MRAISTFLFLAVGLVNCLPVLGVVSAARLHTLYGISFDDPSLVILMRHRAVLFGIVGGILIAGAFHVPLRPTALTVGLASMLSFVLIAQLVGGYNAELGRVVVVDGVASVALIGAVATSRLGRSKA